MILHSVAAMAAFMRRTLGHWYDPAALPIYVVIGGAVGGCLWYCTRLLRSPEVVYSRSNPYPWLDIDPKANPRKLLVNEEKYEKIRGQEKSV